MKEVLLSTCLAWVIVYKLGFRRFKYKPLNCETCMAGWLCLLLCIGTYKAHEIPFYMAAAIVVTIVLNGLIHKL